MKEKILVALGVILFGATSLAAVPTPVMAAGGSCGTQNFLGMKPWYAGLCDGDDSSSNIVTPSEKEQGGISIATFVWTIVLNVLFDLMVAIGYIAVGFVVYGGYLYIMSQGDPTKAQKGKRTLMTAITGVVIAMGASVLVNTAVTILGINTSGIQDNGFNATRVQSIFSWAYSMAGLVAVIFIIKSGIDYMLSQGDPGKTQKATRGIVYAVIGLVVVILAAVITSTVIKSVGGAL